MSWFSARRSELRIVSGEPTRFASTGQAVRSFCPRCGTQLMFEHRDSPDEIGITTCSLDDPAGVPPRMHIHIGSKLPWIELADRLPACLENPENGDNDCPPMTTTADREFVHSKLIDASPERVFEAIADPARLARWWGPDGFSSTFDFFDFRPGGHWRFILHGPDGTDYPNENRFVEIVPAQRVVVDHVSDDHHFVLTITLAREGAATRVGWRQVFDSAQHRDQIAPIVIEANEQNLSRLAAEATRDCA